jgi:hypothetical protein
VQVVFAQEIELPDLEPELAALPPSDLRRMDAVWQRMTEALPAKVTRRVVSWVELP